VRDAPGSKAKNYITPAGLQRLKDERLRQIDSRIRFLTKRIDAAEVVDPSATRPGSAAARVFFGATVAYRDAAGHEHTSALSVSTKST
jgi:transcription elongation factor GreB